MEKPDCPQATAIKLTTDFSTAIIEPRKQWKVFSRAKKII